MSTVPDESYRRAMVASTAAKTEERMRVRKEYIDELIENEGELRTGPINTMGVLRMALDLREARERLREARERIAQLEDALDNPDSERTK